MLVFLDVDGTVIPFGGPGPYPEYGPRDGAVAHPLLGRVDPGLGARLGALGCELVWATTWLDDANEVLSPWLGLPSLPVVDWPDPRLSERGEVRLLHWKTRALVRWAAGRVFVWLDDEITGADRDWVAAHHPAPALLHRVDHRYGLTDADFAVLAEWLSGGPGVR
ncbi:HAD domain-containing protein [Streptomyces sp. NPDC006997]|uniref:HAD domain-containing protein n=1 Tax=Streptomyces sp. NPDC006997 TaxID=3155356 RepID=UPI0033C5FC48